MFQAVYPACVRPRNLSIKLTFNYNFSFLTIVISDMSTRRLKHVIGRAFECGNIKDYQLVGSELIVSKNLRWRRCAKECESKGGGIARR